MEVNLVKVKIKSSKPSHIGHPHIRRARTIDALQYYAQKTEILFPSNGFRKIVLLESKYFKLRLHIFEPINQIVAQENIHDHRWPFSSVCLDGDLTCRIFENDEDTNSEFLHYKYSPVGTSENYSVSPMGNSKLHKSSLLEIQHGTGYYLPVETLHRVINGSDERVITYVVTGTPIKNVCNLYCEHEFESNEVAVERFTDEEIENAITELIYL